MYDAIRARRLRGPLYNQPVVRLRPRTQSERRTWQVWAPNPPRTGTFLIRFVLLDERRREIASRDSAPFRYRVG